MKILVKRAVLINSKSEYNNKLIDVLVEDGVITAISETAIEKNDVNKVFDYPGLHISMGWADLSAQFCDPGFEYKEDIASGVSAAVAGGFTGVGVQPGTSPALHSKSEIEYVVAKSKGLDIEVWPIGSLFVNNEGKDLAELFDMKEAGAVAFSDAKHPIADSGALGRALLYAHNIGAPIMVFPNDKTVAPGGMVHEGAVSTILGLKSMPAIAEELMIDRNITLAQYNQSPIHFTAISTRGAVSRIREAKAQGLKVTAGVNFYNLFLTDEALHSFDANYKVSPPLRTKDDVEALLEGLKDGTVDIINTDHSPENIENKNVEFDYAAYGMLGLEIAFSALNTYVAPSVGLARLIEVITENPRKLIGIIMPEFKEGEKANFTLFHPEEKFTLDNSHLRSKSRNTPFMGVEFKGRVVGIVRG